MWTHQKATPSQKHSMGNLDCSWHVRTLAKKLAPGHWQQVVTAAHPAPSTAKRREALASQTWEGRCTCPTAVCSSSRDGAKFSSVPGELCPNCKVPKQAERVFSGTLLLLATPVSGHGPRPHQDVLFNHAGKEEVPLLALDLHAASVIGSTLRGRQPGGGSWWEGIRVRRAVNAPFAPTWHLFELRPTCSSKANPRRTKPGGRHETASAHPQQQRHERQVLELVAAMFVPEQMVRQPWGSSLAKSSLPSGVQQHMSNANALQRQPVHVSREAAWRMDRPRVEDCQASKTTCQSGTSPAARS